MKLNLEQNRIVELDPNGHILIKGVAGSGKTTVSVMRARYLINNYCPDYDDKVLIVGYNKTLVSYLKYIYDRADKMNSIQLSLGTQNYTNKLEIINVDKLTYIYGKKYENRIGKEFEIIKDFKQRELMKLAVHELEKKYENNNFLDKSNIDFFIEEILWIKACNIESIEEYQIVDRLGRSSSEEGPSRLSKNSLNRKIIYEIKDTYDNYLFKNNLIDYETRNIIALNEVKNNNIEKKYTHIIVDEGQDLTKVQLEFLKALYNEKEYSSFTFSMDNTQSIYTNSWIGRGRPFTTIGFDMSGRTRTLNKNYRTTTEISKSAYSLVERDKIIKNNIDYIEPSYLDRNGPKPVYKKFINIENEFEYISAEIKKINKDYNYKLSDICILYRTGININTYTRILNKNNIKNTFINNRNNLDLSNDSVKLSTMHSIKGLEFKVIFIVDIDQGNIPNDYFRNDLDEEIFESDERKLLYVGMTRAKELLYLTSTLNASKFMYDIDINTLALDFNAKIRPYYDIMPKDYVYKDKIKSIHSSEEKIRQWFIKELINTYNYTLDDIIIEYELNNDIGKSYVDIVVKENGISKVFIELKQLGYDLESAKNQLIDYMKLDKNVKYGVFTNGIEIVVLDRNLDIVDDIEVKKEVETKGDYQNNSKLSYIKKEKLYRIPLVGDVAAGLLKFAEENISDYIDYETNKTLDYYKIFALKVVGDSMKDAGINIGDIVIIKKQNIAEAGDIVIARVNSEATLKRFYRSGSMIILTPENKEYESIIMDEKDVEIDGILIDVLNK